MRFGTVLPALCAAACHAQQAYAPDLHTDKAPPIAAAAQAIDQLKWYADAYGEAGLSSPVLVQPDAAFKFNLSITADQFFTSERDAISGREGGVAGSAHVIGASVAAAGDATAMQQWADSLAEYRRNQAAIARKRAILDEAASQQYEASMRAARQVTDPVARANAEAAAAQQYAQALSGPAADASSPPPPPPTPPALPGLPTSSSITNAAAGQLPALVAPQGLFANGTPSVSGETRAAVLMAAGDVATSAMLATLLDPSKIANLAGREVLWGVSMVSVNPGWKTRVGYSADLQSDIKYTWEWARPEVREAFLAQKNPTSPVEAHALAELQRCVADSLPNEHPQPSPTDLCEYGGTGPRPCVPPAPLNAAAFAPYVFRGGLNNSPVVVAASPMGDAQSLDLQASHRSVRETALQMAFSLVSAGFSSQANAFLNFAKSSQLDVETRSNNIVVSAYSSTGGTFGFRFNPRMIADPAAGRQSEVMQVPTFPTLLVIGMSNNEVHARVYVEGTRNGPNCFVVEPLLELHTATRWARVGSQCETNKPVQSPCLGQELTEEELVVAAEQANRVLRDERDRALAAMEKDPRQSKWIMSYIRVLESRRDHVMSLVAGNQQALWLPADLVVSPPVVDKPKKPTIALGSPGQINLEYDSAGSFIPQAVVMTLAGDNLDQVDLAKVTSPGPAVTAKLADKNVQLAFTVDRPGVYTFVLPIKNDGGAIASPPLVVRAPTAVAIGRTTTKENNRTTDTLVFTPGAANDVIRSEIEKSKLLPTDVKVDVQAGTHATTVGGSK